MLHVVHFCGYTRQSLDRPHIVEIAYMPKHNGKMTTQEKKAAKHYALNGNVTAAGKAAGYNFPREAATRALARPTVAAEVIRVQLARITSETLPLAIQLHIDMLKNPKTPANALVQAIKLAYDRAMGAGAAEGKEPHEMTADEIARALNALKREASDRSAPIIDVESSSVLD